MVALSLTVWDSPASQRCADCGGWRKFFSGEALSVAGGTLAVFMTYLYEHGEREVFTHVTFGRWGADADGGDHVTFASRTGRVEGHSGPVSSLIDGGTSAPPEADLLGARLSREQALAHPLLPEFWAVNDLILAEIAEDAESWVGVGTPGPRRRWSKPRRR